MNVKEWINKRRYRDVMRISLPLVMSMAGTTVMEFTDRVFLANYSLNAIAAAMPAGLMAYLFIAFFVGIAGYLNVFIGQYTGASAANRIGTSLWQGIYFSILSGAALVCLSFTAKPLFHLSEHSQEVQQLEVVYFRILCLGAGMNMVGRVGKTELAITNIVLSINALAYIPAIGFSLGTSTLVGQSLGGSHPKAAIDVAKSTIHILLAYTFLLILVFVFVPVWVLGFFSLANQGTLEQAKLLNMGVVLLRIVSVYLFFDFLLAISTGKVEADAGY